MAQQSKTNPILKAYLLATAAFLIPSWIASALITEEMGPDNLSPGFITILILFALTCWSPSIGLMMFKKWTYGLLSGLGRLLIIIACAYTDQQMLADMPEGQGHPYLTFLGIMAAFTWGVVDYVLIYFFGKKYLNQSQS